jgi:hypothetical protein
MGLCFPEHLVRPARYSDREPPHLPLSERVAPRLPDALPRGQENPAGLESNLPRVMNLEGGTALRMDGEVEREHSTRYETITNCPEEPDQLVRLDEVPKSIHRYNGQFNLTREAKVLEVANCPAELRLGALPQDPRPRDGRCGMIHSVRFDPPRSPEPCDRSRAASEFDRRPWRRARERPGNPQVGPGFGGPVPREGGVEDTRVSGKIDRPGGSFGARVRSCRSLHAIASTAPNKSSPFKECPA